MRMLLIAASTVCAAWPLPVPGQATPEATIDTGGLRGVRNDGVDSWKGIPFAAPPIGALRWRAPQPVASWSKPRDATRYEHDCMQRPFGGDAAPLGTTPDEDCLYANVWRPSVAKGKLPVIVWIYGGGFVNGGASPPTYSGFSLARQGVVFVSANYRVGRFGTFAHPGLTARKEDGASLGNYGYLDQIAALLWVRRNVAAFGGDPANVTIIGESAGGASVHNLVTSPLARGLFAKAVVMSGLNGESLGQGGLAEAEQVGTRFAASKGIPANDPKAVDKLRALSADDVTDGLNLMALFEPGPRTFSSPFVDGTISVHAGMAYDAGRFAHVPMLIGATDDDAGGRTGPMVAGARHISATIGSQQVPVWEYRFSYVAQSIGKPGAGHATDIPFFLDTQAIKYGDKTTRRDDAMGKTISAYLVNFARSGDPNGRRLPTWPRYRKGADQIMNFSARGVAVPEKDPWAAELAAAPRGTSM